MDKIKVGFIYIRNTCRSQMVEVFHGIMAGDHLEVYSTGTHPAG